MSYITTFATPGAIQPTEPPVISNLTSLAFGELNEPFEFQPTATGEPAHWEAVGLPPGLSINGTTGKITGTPTEGGLYSVLLKAHNFEIRGADYDQTQGGDPTLANSIGVAYGTIVNGDIVAATGSLPAPLNENTLYQIVDASEGNATHRLIVAGSVGVLSFSGGGAWSLVKRRTGTLTLIMPICEEASSRFSSEDDITLDINMDVLNGAIQFPAGDGLTWSPATENRRQEGLRYPYFNVKSGDRFPVSIGLYKDGKLQDLDISDLRIGAKEFTPESLIELTDGTFTKLGSGRDTRYLAELEISESAWQGILSNYEEDDGTHVDAHCEIQIRIGGGSNNYWDAYADSEDTTKTLDVYQDGDRETFSFLFVGLPDTGGDDVDLTFNLVLSSGDPASGESDPDLSAQVGPVTFEVSSDGGVWDLSNDPGEATDLTAFYDGWQVKLTRISFTNAGSNNILVSGDIEVEDPKVTTTFGFDFYPDYGNIGYANGDWRIQATGDTGGIYEIWEFYEAYDSGGFGGQLVGTYEVPGGANATRIQNDLRAMFGNNSILVSIDSNSVSLYNIPGDVERIFFPYNGSREEYRQSIVVEGLSEEYDFDIVGTMSMPGQAQIIDDILIKTSETFILAIEKDLVEDGNAQ